jgi:hypothetical protein
MPASSVSTSPLRDLRKISASSQCQADGQMCNLYSMNDEDWVSKRVQDVESLINQMPAYQVNPDQMGPIARNTANGREQLFHARWSL